MEDISGSGMPSGCYFEVCPDEKRAEIGTLHRHISTTFPA